MKLKFELFFVGIFICLFIFSCSNNPASPTYNYLASDYYPMTKGSWWKYNYCQTDSLGNKVDNGSLDSQYVADYITIDGENSMMVISRTLGGNPSTDTNYYFQDHSRIFRYANLALNNGLMDSSQNYQWIQYLDFTGNKIKVFNSDTAIFDSDAKANIIKHYESSVQLIDGNNTFNFNNVNYPACIIKVTGLSTSSESVMGNNIQHNIFFEWTYTLCKGIGIVEEKSILTNQRITNGKITNGTGGGLMELKDYSIK